MASILCIETATTNCSVALSVNGSVAVLVEDNSNKYSHAERLHIFIEQVLNEAEIDKSTLDAIAVSKGPGSYTGLRIGVSAAKGLCFALDIPLISIPTLDSLALQVRPNKGMIVSMLDARRMEVYSAVFSSEGNQVRDTQAEILIETSFTQYLEQEPVLFIGTGVEKFEPICQHKNATFLNDKLPSAYQMAELAEAKYKISDIENVAYFEPYYLKDFLITVPKK
ncbi:MAG: tRNA threonylcarbamoyladenosine biosynthesis protein TsaB [Flavobacteriaceae bacterium]|jgi:tRNA threonylcarbamoyladenosine biosynthesis protein TsaB